MNTAIKGPIIAPTKIWTKEEWDALDYTELSKSPFRDLLKTETFRKLYR